MSIKLEEKIGEGFYADVWRATDKLDRKVAVKILRRSAPYYSNAMAHAKALARVQHRNIVTLFALESVTIPDTNEAVDGIVMELIEGQTLQDRLGQDRLTPDEVFALSGDLINGLEHIHSVGLVHNDLHSRNILVSKSDLKIIDILYTDSLMQANTQTRREKIRHDIRDLTSMLFDIAQHSNIDGEMTKIYGLALQSSEIGFDTIRQALQSLNANMKDKTGAVINSTESSGNKNAEWFSSKRSLRNTRLDLSDNERLPIDWSLAGGARIFFHAYPSSDESSPGKDLIRNKTKNEALFKPLGPVSGWDYESHRDGLISYRSEQKWGYCYLTNNADCEAVDCFSLSPHDQEKRYLPARYLEKMFAESLSYYLDCYKKLGFKTQLLCGFSILGIRGYYISVEESFRWSLRPVRALKEDRIIFPEIVIPNLTIANDPMELLRAGFDEMWQLYGFDRCLHYGEDGVYVKGR